MHDEKTITVDLKHYNKLRADSEAYQRLVYRKRWYLANVKLDMFISILYVNIANLKSVPIEIFAEILNVFMIVRNIRQNSDVFYIERIAACYKYTCKENPEPAECQRCPGDLDCEECPIHGRAPSYNEHLTLDAERLIAVTKAYALHGKDAKIKRGRRRL